MLPQKEEADTGERKWHTNDNKKPRVQQGTRGMETNVNAALPSGTGPRAGSVRMRSVLPYTATSSSTSLARRLRATCRRRLMVPTGASNSSDISISERPFT
jgi:hypothetical protein